MLFERVLRIKSGKNSDKTWDDSEYFGDCIHIHWGGGMEGAWRGGVMGFSRQFGEITFLQDFSGKNHSPPP